MPLLKRLSNNKIKKTPNAKNNYNKHEDNEKKFNNMIENINDFLSQCLKDNKINQKDLYIENLIRKEFDNKLKRGFYVWISNNMKIDIEIINIYKSITGNFPLAITTLLCTKETNEEEITSFIYRTILCEFRVLFIIIGSDNLELSKAQYLLWILDSLYIKYNKKINTTLLFAFSDNNSALKKELTKLKDHNYFISKEFINNNIPKNNKKYLIEVWSSDATGVGKSTQIRLEAKINSRKYIYFPIGGVITRKDIINRIINLEINNKYLGNICLHIDIYDSNEETSTIIREFLFSLLITRSYSYDERIFYLDYGVKIVIEIPIGFYDMKDKFILLDYFPSKKISLDNLPDLIDLEDKNNSYNHLTDIQLITHILLMLENGTIEEKEFDLDKRYEEIPIKRCQNIINKYFALPKGNYYQKNAFIHILADQFRKFCFSFYLKPEILHQNENAINNKIPNINNIKKIIENNNNNMDNNKQILQNNIKEVYNNPNNYINQENNNINNKTNIHQRHSHSSNAYKKYNIANNKKNQPNINYNINAQNNIFNTNRKSIQKNKMQKAKIEINNIKINNYEDIKIEKFKITYVRKIMIENLIKLTLYFIKGPFTKIILNQKSAITQIFGEFNKEKINEIANKYLSNIDEERISFEKINPSLVFFNEDVQTFSIITTSKKGDEEYMQLLRLYNSQNNINDKEIPLINYRNLTHEQFLSEVKNVLNLNKLSIERIKNIIGSYCFTSDNFIKMILILLRIRAGIPVIMMGETGCGKTSLIKTLSALLNQGQMNLKIMNIHAGIEDKDIIGFIEEVNNEINNEDKGKPENNNINTSNDKIWVFFDEINTCNSMGLLSEIFYNHSYNGKKLNNKLTFIAACNPYRLKIIKNLDKDDDDFCLTSKDKKYSYNSKQNLVYLVNPLPHSLLTSIFDFGCLSSDDEKKYIKNIVKETLQKYNTNEELEFLFVEEIVECQNFVRDHNDISSVSLRDLRRFSLLFEFFVKYLKQRNEVYDEESQILIKSMLLSLYFCFYIRLSNNKLRGEIVEKINQKIKKQLSFEDVIQKEKDILISKMEKKIPQGIAKNSTLKENIFSLFVCIVNKIPLIMCGKPGTSKSLSFQILYDCMKGSRSDDEFFKNYPEVLIFSYQGSKTSTSEGVQKVFNKAKTCLKKHQEKLQKKRKELVDKLYSEIKKSNIQINAIIIANKLKKKQEIIKETKENKEINENKENKENNENKENKENKETILPVIYFDEMGLAEESPHNPLKVIHSELEYDDRDQQFGFVGISNWKLDASKMNRAIFLGVPNLEENDLQETAYEIAQNLDQQILIKYKDLFSNLVKTYWSYKNFTKNKEQSEFHGLRDFYHLIKSAMFYLKINNQNNEEEELNIIEKSYEVGLKSLYRNFDGLKEPFNSYEEIKKIFNQFYPNNNSKTPNVFECLKDNINDNNSRFLLIITKSSMSIHLLEDIMHKLGKQFVFYNGSQLSEDLNDEKYNEKLLNKIQLSLENGDILVLRNMENIYPSLYNLFNQNFTQLGNKRFCRIAFANYNTYSVVHEDFRAIILVDEKKIEEKVEDPPFLNRFEKHIFSFEYLMSEGELNISKNIIDYFDKILLFNKKDCKIDLHKQVLWYNSEEIKGLVLKNSYEYDKEKENIMKFEKIISNNIFQIISKLLSQDIMASIIYNENELHIENDIKEHYRKNHIYNFYQLFDISKNIFIKGKNIKLIIYTFSKLLESILKENSPIVSQFGNLNRENIIEKIVKSIKNDSDFDIIINDFYEKEEKKILVFKFNENDLDKINQLRFKIKSIENEKNKNRIRVNRIQGKHIIFIICLTRHKIMNKKSSNDYIIDDLISNIDSEYSQFFIDNLNGSIDSNIIDIMSKSPSFYIEQIFDLKNNYLLKIFQKVFSFLTYQFQSHNIDIQHYIGEIISKLLKNDFILNLLKNKLVNELGKTLNNFIKTIFSKGIYEKNDIEFKEIIFNTVFDKVYLLIFKFIFKAEKEQLLYPLLLNYDFIKDEITIKKYIQKYIDNIDFNIINVVERINSNQIFLYTNLVLPLSKKWYNLMTIFIENNIKNDYLSNEDRIRLSYFENKEIIKEMSNYEIKKQDIINNTKGEILRIEGLNDLIESKNIKITKILYQDFIRIYLNQKFNDNFVLGLQFIDILMQLKLNINRNDNYSFIKKKNKISLQDSFLNLNKPEQDKENNQNMKYDVDTLAKIIIFLISYNEEIFSILEIFFTLNKYLKNFFNDWKDLIIRKEIKYEINDNVPEYTREINEAFFIMYESLIKCIFSYTNYKEMNDNDFYEYLEAIKKIMNDAKQIYLKLYLPSKEMYTLQILINIFISYDSCKIKRPNKNIKELFIEIIKNIISENTYINSKNYIGVENNFNELLSILDKLFVKSINEINEKEYIFLLNNLFISRYNKVLDNDYRKLLVKVYFNNITNKQVKFIMPILKRLINDIEPKYSDNEKENLNAFMSNFYFEKEDLMYSIYKIIVDKNNDTLNLNVLYYFECECELYFKKISKGKALNQIKNEELEEYSDHIIKNLSIKYFKKAMEYYLEETILNELEKNIKNIGKIYSLAYIKKYLEKVAHILIYNINKNILNFVDIFNILLCKNNNKNIKSLKIYFFKCIFKFSNQNYIEYFESIKTERNLIPLLNHDDFGNLFTILENKHCYNFSFLNINNYEIYNKILQIIDISSDNFEQHPEYNYISKFIADNKDNCKNIELIFNILINKFIFDIHENKNLNNNLGEKAILYVKCFEKMNITLNRNTNKLINYLIDRNLFETKILTKLKLPKDIALNEDLFYIIFFAIKLVISIQAFKSNIYSNFYRNKENLVKDLSTSFFPGAYPQNNEQISSYYEIEEHLRNQNPKFAIYMCSCGKYYTVRPCGFPVDTSKCQKCGEIIGGTNHKLYEREGHFRIILDEKAKVNIIDNGFDKKMKYMLLKDFKKEKIDPLLNKAYKGIGKISREIINKTGYKIRNIDELPFRLMNFIIYSHLLVSNILEVLDDKEISKYFSEETSCFDIMRTNWNKIQEILNQMDINNIKIFMNIIFERIIAIVSKYNRFTINTQEGRNKIESEFNKFIDFNIIKKDIALYEKQNQQLLNSSPYHISSLIQQLYPASFYKNEEPYPHFKYLYLNPLPTISGLLGIIESNNDYKSRYPLTLKVIKHFEENNKVNKLLKYLPKINKKLNYLIDNYSYKITRDEASKKTIKEEFNKLENNIFKINNLNQDDDVNYYMKDLFKLFNKFKNIDLQWGCHPLSKMTINENSNLCSILLDDNEPGYYLASIYKKLIEHQNLFLDNIINCNSQSGLLHCFVKQLKSEIMIQDASVNEIVKLQIGENEKNNLKLYSDLDELIFVNTSNNPFSNKFNYELNQIEIELGNIILPGVRKFKSTDDELRFITYIFEGYRGKKSNILTNFNEKYPPKELSQNEKELLVNCAKDKYTNSLLCIQILINYIQNSGKPENTSIYEIISNIPEHINIDENIRNIFVLNKDIKINKLVRIFEFFEHQCWNQIQDNLLEEFMKPLSEEKIKLIDNYYKYNKENGIKKIELATAIRKFISRYLAGKRSQSEIGEDKMLFDYLTRVDLWERNIDDPAFENEIFKLSKLQITVGEGKAFYDKLGGDNEILNSFIKNKDKFEYNDDEKDKNKIEINNNEQNVINIYKKKKVLNDDENEDEEESFNKKKNEIKIKNDKNKVKRRKLF